MRNWILEEAHGSRYAIHPGSTKMYPDFRELFLCEGMKKDIVELAAKCPNLSQVKAEYKNPGGLHKKSKFLL